MKKLPILLGLLWLLAGCADKPVYLFTYFTDNGQDGLHMAYSYDGLNWQALRDGKSFLSPEIGVKEKLMRDPSIVRGPDGTYHMVWTPGWYEQQIGYASSKDLIHWSEQQGIPVMENEPTTLNCWAPELFYDEPSDTFYILWASTIPGRHKEVPTVERPDINHRIYYTTTRDFKTFTEGKIFFDPDFSAIDAAIIRERDGRLLMVVKNENSLPAQKNLRLTRTDRIEDGFPTEVSEPIHPPYWAEGPSPLYVGEYLYIYYDQYMNHRYGGVRSRDGIAWEDISEQMTFPEGMRHGTAFQVPEKVLKKLLEP